MNLFFPILLLLLWFNTLNATPAFSTPKNTNKSNLTESTITSPYPHAELEASPEGREFLGCYERVSRAYLLLSAGKIGFGVFKNSVNLMKSSWTKFKTSNFFANYKTLNPTNATKLESEVKGVLDEVDKLDGVVVSGVGKIIPNSVDEIKHLLKTDNGTSFFWSGKTNGVGGEIKALEIAKLKGGITLEGLLKEKNIELPAWDPNNPSVMKLWEDVSAEYAKQVSGEVRAVIGQQLRPGNIWETKELPALMSNINVSKITTIDPVTLIETVIFTR